MAGGHFYTATSFALSLNCIQNPLAGDLSSNEDISSGLVAKMGLASYVLNDFS